MTTVDFLVARFKLQPLEIEGGMFHRYYLGDEELAREALPPRYGQPRQMGSAICYLYQPHTQSLLHRLLSDEIYHFYRGDPVTMLLLYTGGKHEVRTLGADYEAGHEPFMVVPRGVWQGSFLNSGGAWALVGCTLAPAYDDADFELGDRELLLRQYPTAEEWVRRLTPADRASLLSQSPEKAAHIRVQQ